MNIENLYIADLRIVTNLNVKDALYYTIRHRHLKFVLVKVNERHKYEDILTKESYYASGSIIGEVYIDPNTIFPFSNYVNKCFDIDKSHMRKKKVLSLYRNINRIDSKEGGNNEKNI